MIDAPAGSGKAFTICALSAHPRANGKKLVPCTASAGISALLLPGGLAAPSTSKPFTTAVPLWRQTSQILSSFSPKQDCSSKRVNIPFVDNLTKEGSSCNVLSLKASALKFFVERTFSLFWDEIPMSNKIRSRNT